MTDSDRVFRGGVLWAVARIIELHDQPGIAADVLRESGFGLDLRHADEYDRPFLRRLYKESAFRRERRAQTPPPDTPERAPGGGT